MFRSLIAALLFLHPSISYAEENPSCIGAYKAAGVFGKEVGFDYYGNDVSVKKAYADLLKSGLIEYGSDRPILYSTNISFTKFFKRICHDTACDAGDANGTLDNCIFSAKEHCNLIAATRGKDLYCLLVPIGWYSYGEPHNPFR